jgi:hypothetical protein
MEILPQNVRKLLTVKQEGFVVPGGYGRCVPITGLEIANPELWRRIKIVLVVVVVVVVVVGLEKTT